MAFNSEITDNFNRSDGTGLGDDWTVVTGGYSIDTNRAKVTSTSTPHANAVHSDTLSTTEQYAQAIITNAGDFQCGFYLRGNSNLTTGYATLFRTSNIDVVIYRKVGGHSNFTLLLDSASFTIASGDLLKMAVEGTGATVTLTAYVDGEEVATVDDTNAARLTSGGYCGFMGATTNSFFDDFEAGTIGEAGGAATFIPRVMMF